MQTVFTRQATRSSGTKLQRRLASAGQRGTREEQRDEEGKSREEDKGWRGNLREDKDGVKSQLQNMTH